MQNNTATIRLTEYARGAGCGCKISPQVLSSILQSAGPVFADPKLLVGNSSNDDAAVYDMGNGSALISTADFFTPVVDDAFDFGRIAAANAISDVYAMGGQPVMALALLGWPVDRLPSELAARVLDGAREICSEAGISLAGGHSIDSPEPIFGLSVNGLVPVNRIKKNNTARSGDLIFLTKPLGSGILATAGKRKLLDEDDKTNLIAQMTTLNKIGAALSEIKAVTAMTDVTGFGLLGHLLEICRGSDLGAIINFGSIPKFRNIAHYISQGIIPDATYRNWNAYQGDLELSPEVNATEGFMLLPDPQTNGGILFTAGAEGFQQVCDVLAQNQLEAFAQPIGKMADREGKIIKVIP